MKQYIFLLFLCVVFHVPGISTLPPIDRDESRFAQATAQMLESGDFVRIRFQEEARNKKPVGIYWLQSAAVAISGTQGAREIWPYRLPSLLGAMVAVLLTFWIGKRLFDRETAFMGAALFSASILLVIEAHLATTDAVLLATIVAAQGALSRYYLRRDPDSIPGVATFLTFWFAQAIGILVKGPLTPLISLLTVSCLVAADRKAGWLRNLRPLRGLLIVAAIVSPWLIAISVATKGAFFQDSIGRDLLSKVGSAQELHGFPPGFYLLLLPITLWPASFFLGPALVRTWKSRSNPTIRFCMAWIIPIWIMFELIPTKLPHYVLPTYPALCLLIAESLRACSAGAEAEIRSVWVRFGATACALVILIAGIGISGLPYYLDGNFQVWHLVSAIAASGTAVLFAREMLKFQYVRAAAIAIVGTALVLSPALQWILPNTNALWLSRGVADQAHKHTPAGLPIRLASAGYYEPSLVFLLGTQTLLTSSSQAALFLRQQPNGLALIGAAEDEEFRRIVRRFKFPVAELATIQGFNYTLGKNTTLRLYGRVADQETSGMSPGKSRDESRIP